MAERKGSEAPTRADNWGNETATAREREIAEEEERKNKEAKSKVRTACACVIDWFNDVSFIDYGSWIMDDNFIPSQG